MASNATPAGGTAEVAQDAPPPTDAPPKKSRVVLILAAVGIAAGSATGLLGVGPAVAARASQPKPAAEESHDTTTATSTATHTLDNLILNPAGTGGTRFLMVTAAIQVRNGDVDAQLTARSPEVRDHILAVLGRKTVDQLTDVNGREAIKQEVLATVAAMFKKGDVVRIYFPQFVVQ
jgi:flagellar FliL protein